MDAAFSFVLSGGRDHRVFRTPLCNLSNNELLFIDEQPIQKVIMGAGILKAENDFMVERKFLNDKNYC